MKTAKLDQTAEALQACLISPNVSDANGEAANVVDGLDSIARAIDNLARAVRELANVQATKDQ